MHAVVDRQPKDLSDVVQKTEPYYFDYGEYEDLWKAKPTRSRGCSELQRQVCGTYNLEFCLFSNS